MEQVHLFVEQLLPTDDTDLLDQVFVLVAELRDLLLHVARSGVGSSDVGQVACKVSGLGHDHLLVVAVAGSALLVGDLNTVHQFGLTVESLVFGLAVFFVLLLLLGLCVILDAPLVVCEVERVVEDPKVLGVDLATADDLDIGRLLGLELGAGHGA